MRFGILQIIVGMSTAAVLQHSLIWRKSKTAEMMEQGEYAAYVKYRNALRSSSLITIRQLVLDYGDYEYVANITVGTPNQQFTVVPDTGSSTSWVAGSECNATCHGKHKFVPSLSTTFVETNRTWSVTYLVGEANGIFGTDIMKFIGLNQQQLVIPNTTFGLAKYISPDLQEDNNDGVLGLGLGINASDIMPPVINAIHQNLLERPIFTVWMEQRGRDEKIHGGLFTYGAVDAMNCGPVIAYEPITSSTHYLFKISAVGMGNYTHSKVYEVAADTGTPLIGGPKVIIQKLAEVAGAVYNATEDAYKINCNVTTPTLDFTIGTNKYPIEPTNYAGRNSCYLAVFPLEFAAFGASWVLGTPFIHQFCYIFDIGQKQIGFALSLQK